MADTAARLAIFARRNEVARFTIVVTGIDLTGVVMNMQVRLARGTPGAPLIQLATVTTAAAEGLKLDGVTVTDGVPTSVIKGRINKSTMDDATKVPYSGEQGTDTVLAYAMQWTLNGDANTRIEGDFIVRDTAYGSDNAPSNRPAGYGAQVSCGGSSGTLTFGDQIIAITLASSDLVGVEVAKAVAAALAAATARDTILNNTGFAAVATDLLLGGASKIAIVAANLGSVNAVAQDLALGAAASFILRAPAAATSAAASAAGAASTASGIQGSLDTISALSPLATITDTVVGVAPATGIALAANTNAYANGLLPVGHVTKLESYVTTVGSGAIEFDVATFTGALGLTRKRVSLNVSTSVEGAAAPGIKTWTQAVIEAAAGGQLLTVANSQVGIYLVSGGAVVPRIAGSGFIFTSGAPTEGGSRTYGTFASFEVALRVTVRSAAISVAQQYLEPPTQTAVKLAQRALKDTSGVYGLTSPGAATSVAATTVVFGTEANRTVAAPGLLTEYRATINGVGDGRVMVLIATRAGTSSGFATRKKITLNLSASSIGSTTGIAVWTQAAIEAANGGPVPTAAGETVGQYAIPGGASLARSNTGDTNSATGVGEPVIGTPYAYTLTNAGTPQYGFSTTSVELAASNLDTTGRTAVAEATKGARLRSRRTLLTDIAFNAAASSDWTQTSGTWTQSAAGWQSPASPTAYTTALSYAPYRSNLRRRTMEWEIAPTTTATSVLFGWETFIQNMCSAVTVDWGAGLLRMKKSMATGASNAGFISEPGDFSTVVIPAAVPGRKYQVRLTVDERTNTYELWDTVTGLMLASLQDNVSGLLTYNQVTGGQFGRPVVRPLADQVTISRLRIIGNCRKGVELYIAGDSETDGQGLLVASRWATLVGEDVGDYVVSARPGENSDIVDFLWTYEVSKILPKRVLLFLGINTQTINQAKFNTFISNCQAVGIEVAVCLCPPTTYGTPTAANTYLLGLDASIPKVRLDLALTTNNDGVTMNPAYFQADNIHVNTPAGPVVAARVKFDWDTLVGAS